MAETMWAVGRSPSKMTEDSRKKEWNHSPFESNSIPLESNFNSNAMIQRRGRRDAVLQAKNRILAANQPIQAWGGSLDGNQSSGIHQLADKGTQGGGGALPHLDAIQASFGKHDVSGVKAHTDSNAKEAAQGMGAMAFARGEDVVLDSQDLFTVAHEAAHVVQQRGGVQLRGGVGQVGDVYENHADAVASKVEKGESAEALLSERSGGQGGDTAIQQRAGGDSQVDGGMVEKELEVDGFGSDLTHGIGNIIDALLPDKGMKAKLQVNVNVKIPAYPDSAISLRFVTELDRDESNNVTLKAEIGVGLQAKVDLWLFDICAQVLGFGFIETRGDSGFEAFRLIDLVMYNAIASVSEDAAEVLYGETAIEDIKRDVVQGPGDTDDYAMGGFGLEASLGFSSQEIEGYEGKGTFRHQAGKKYMANDGEKGIDVSSTKYTLGITLGEWEGEFTYDDQMTGGQSSGELEIWGAKAMDLLTFKKLLGDTAQLKQLGASFATNAISGTMKLLQGRSGVLQKDSGGGQTVGGMLGMAKDFSLNGEAVTNAAIDKLMNKYGDDFASSVGIKGTIKIGWSSSGTSIEFWLDRYSKMEYGGENDEIYVLLENISGIFYSGKLSL